MCSPSIDRVLNASASSSSPAHSADTSELDSDETPSSSATSPTLRVLTPATYISRTSATMDASTRV